MRKSTYLCKISYFEIHYIYLQWTELYSVVFAMCNVFQATDPQTDGEMEQGPPYIYTVTSTFL